VRDGETGVLFHEPTSEALEDALRTVQARRWERAPLRLHAESFSEQRFEARFRAVLAVSIEQRKLGRLGADDAA
jgi:hypothetical protein